MNLFKKIYLRYCIASGFPYGAYLKKKGGFRSMGIGCYIAKSANITDPYLTCLGSNVWVTSGCQLICHDASVIMLNIMHSEHFDRVSPIIIGDNVFLGNNAIVLPGVTIGSGCIIGAGSVVTRDIPDNSVCAGNPGRIISSLDAYVEKIARTTRVYPWYSLLHRHARHIYDPRTEQLLRAARISYFFGER